MRRGFTTTVRRRRWNPWYVSITHSLRRGSLKQLWARGRRWQQSTGKLTVTCSLVPRWPQVPVRRLYNAFRKKFDVIGLACLSAAMHDGVRPYAAHVLPSCTPSSDVFLTVSYCHIIAPDSKSAVSSIVSDSDIYALPVIQLSLMHCRILILWAQRLIPLSFSKYLILVLPTQMLIPLPSPLRLILIP